MEVEKDISIAKQEVKVDMVEDFIKSTMAMFEAQGRDFYGEFIEYAKEKGAFNA